MVMKNIACFITGGWTEAGEMQFFLEKIRSDCNFYQCFPHKPKVRRNAMGQLYKEEMQGETGEILFEKVLGILKDHPEYNYKYDAILIEDDLDMRFKDKTDVYIQEHYSKMTRDIVEAFGREVPVIILYASPEIESWFLTDWDNCFKGVYSSKTNVPDLSLNERLHFINRLAVAINNIIDTTTNIELFGYDQPEYIKLSDLLLKLFEPDNIRNTVMKDSSNNTFRQRICNSRYLYYSKKTHGSMMLRKADPEIIQKKCDKFFRKGYDELRQL